MIFVIFVSILVWVFCYGVTIGVAQNEIPSLIVNALLMLLATFVGISLPLYATAKVERQKKEEALRSTYISIARYIGEELAGNISTLEELASNNDKTLKELGIKTGQAADNAMGYTAMGIWKVVAEDSLISLEDVKYKSLIMSGILTEVPDDEMNSAIGNSYSEMANLMRRLRRMSIFFDEILSPPPNFPPQRIEVMLKTKVPELIKCVEEDMSVFLKSAKVAIKQINKTIKPYGKEVKIATYCPEKLT
ncbi:MAG: hypothetical protein WC632_00470 [Candidatus Margulisiibacteriota bacterium]